MKKILYLLGLTTLISFYSFAQDDDGGRMPEKMAEYISQKLDMNKSEKDRFIPLFLDYHKELRKTTMDNRGDRLILQQKIVDLRLRYRDQFRSVVGDKRSNEVYFHEREFIREAQEIRRERQERRVSPKRNNEPL
jgi:hypothetical protein